MFSQIGTAIGEDYTPGYEKCGKENCIWEIPMNITNESKIWSALIQPIIVIDGDPRSQTKIYSSPDSSSPVVGEVTCMSQGVHVLETTNNGWTRVECYSSSFKGSSVQQYNRLIVGYIRSELLKERDVEVEYALVVDKLTQKLYVFHEGSLLDTLSVSTGYADEEHPWNETRSGEYILNSPTGAFPSDNFICNYGIRYNDGDLIHEVPHIPDSSGSNNYGYTEPLLGTKASHGCIRVQRKRTPNGINMRWLWNELRDKMGTRLVIWEDWQGRQLTYPDSSLQLFYNPVNGECYHAAGTCYGVRDKYLPLTAFTYGQLDEDPFAKLNPCSYCNPPLRQYEIDLINLQYR